MSSSDDDENEDEAEEPIEYERLFFHDLEKGKVMYEAKGPDLNFLYCKSTEQEA